MHDDASDRSHERSQATTTLRRSFHVDVSSRRYPGAAFFTCLWNNWTHDPAKM